jgi:putative transposase
LTKVRETDSRVPGLQRRKGASGNTLYRWKSKLGGMEDSEAERLRELEQENAKLKDVPEEHGLAEQREDRTRPSSAGGQSTTTKDFVGRSGTNRPPCSPEKSPDMLNFPNRTWLGSRGMVEGLLSVAECCRRIAISQPSVDSRITAPNFKPLSRPF